MNRNGGTKVIKIKAVSSSMKKVRFTVKSTSSVNPHNEALVKFGNELIQKAVETLASFSKTMITLVSGLFAVYFALLKFLGTETESSATFDGVKDTVMIPPILFILSLIAFVVSILPLLGRISLVMPDSIERYRSRIMIIRYSATLIGVGLLVVSFVLIINIAFRLLKIF